MPPSPNIFAAIAPQPPYLECHMTVTMNSVTVKPLFVDTEWDLKKMFD